MPRAAGLRLLSRGLAGAVHAPPLALRAAHVPEGWPPGAAARFDRQPTPSLIPRAADATLDAAVDAAPLSVLDGPRGVGKSAALLRLVVAAREAGDVVVYVPSARRWTHGPGFFSAAALEGKEPAVDGVGAVRWYDRPRQTLELLDALRDAHGEELAGIPCALETPAREDARARTVRDLVDHGVAVLRDVDADWRVNPARGGAALDAVVRELAAQDAVPFMLAIDEYGSFVGLADLVSGTRRRLYAGGIRAVGELFGRDALPTLARSIRRGRVVVALDASHGAESCRSSRVDGTVEYPVPDGVRRDPSGRAWLAAAREYADARADGVADDDLLDEDAALDPVRVSAADFAKAAAYFDVPEWSNAEAARIVSGFVQETKMDKPSEAERARLFALAGGRADLLQKLCMAY